MAALGGERHFRYYGVPDERPALHISFGLRIGCSGIARFRGAVRTPHPLDECAAVSTAGSSCSYLPRLSLPVGVSPKQERNAETRSSDRGGVVVTMILLDSSFELLTIALLRSSLCYHFMQCKEYCQAVAHA